MRVFIIGTGTNFGLELCAKLKNLGYSVKALLPKELTREQKLKYDLDYDVGNYLTVSEVEFKEYFRNCDYFLPAIGLAGGVSGAKPLSNIYDLFNVKPQKKLLELAMQCGVKNVVMRIPFFSYFDKIYTDLGLAKNNPYVESWNKRMNEAIEIATMNSMNLSILYYPFVIGDFDEYNSLWQHIVEMIKSKKIKRNFFGRTAFITTSQLIDALCGAMQKNKGIQLYPLGYYNDNWDNIIEMFKRELQEWDVTYQDRPKSEYIKMMASHYMISHSVETQSGLNPEVFYNFMQADTTVDKSYAMDYLCEDNDDIVLQIKNIVNRFNGNIENNDDNVLS